MKSFKLPNMEFLTEGKLALHRFLAEEKKKGKLSVRFAHSFRTSHTTRSVCALGVFAAVLVGLSASNIGFVYDTAIDGESVGYVTTTSELRQAMSAAESHASDVLSEDYTFEKPVTTTCSIAKTDECISSSDLTEAITQQIDEIQNLAVLSIDGIELGAMETAEDLQAVLDTIKGKFTQSLEDPDNATVTFQQNVTIRYQDAPSEMCMTAEELSRLINPGSYITSYTVPENPTTEQIMADTSATLESLTYLNPTVKFELQAEETDTQTETASTAEASTVASAVSEVSEQTVSSLAADSSAVSDTTTTVSTTDAKTELTEGMQLAVLNTVSNILTVQVTEVEHRTEEIPYEIVTKTNDQLAAGTRTVLQTGSVGSQNITEEVTYVNGVRHSSTQLECVVTKEPTQEIVEIGTKAVPSVSAIANSADGSVTGTGTMIRPFAAGRISSNYGYRGSEFHTGVDFAGTAGSNVVAADSGTVIWAGAKGNYGNCVMISHGNGLVTLYAHNSSLDVSVGDAVSQGTVIAKVGSTGRSTGPHCHFEVRLYGEIQNPWNYIS